MSEEDLKSQQRGKTDPSEVSRESLVDFICKILDTAIENRNADAMAQESVRDLINDAHKK